MKRITARDWSVTQLGAIEEWPRSLHAALNICLASESASSICWGTDLTIIFNESWEKLFGADPDSLGLPAREVFEDWETLEPYFEEVLARGEVRETELPTALYDNAEQPVKWSFSPIYGGNGSVKGVFAIAQISQSDTKTEDLFEYTDKEFHAFFDNAPIGIHWLSADGTILKANQAELDMVGYTRDEYVGRNITEFYVDDEFVSDVLQCLQEGEEVINRESQMKHKDGSIIEISLSSNVYRKNGEFIHTRCFTQDITNHKRWQRELEESESRYRTLIDNFPKGAVALFDKDLRYLAVGGELMNQVGVKQEDRVGNKITDLYSGEILNEIRPYYQQVFEGKSNSFEIEYHGRHLLCYTLPIKGDQGDILSGMLVVQDITQRWQAQQALHESEAKFRMMAENLSEIIWMLSGDGEELIYINPAFEEIWGIDREKLYDNPLNFLEAVHPEDRDRVEKRFTSPQDDFDDTYRIIRPDGEVRWLHARGTRIHYENSQINRTIGIAEDITKRKNAEQKLRKSRNRLKAALDIETVGVIFWGGEDLTIKETNDAFLEMSGFSREEIVGKSWKELTPEEFYSVSENAIADIKTKGHTAPYEKQYIRKDGSRWWGLFAPRRIDENEVVEFVIDITELKKVQEELKEVNATLEERVKERTKKLSSYRDQLRRLASQLNKAEERERRRLATELHDALGQMLAVAKMKVEELQFDHFSTELEKLEEIIDETLRYNQNLMTELKPPPVLNKEDVTEVLLWTAKQMEKHGLDITVEDDGHSKPVDEELRTVLHQSVRELFQNVLKHAGVTKARMKMFRRGNSVRITVEDRGSGFEVNKSWLYPPEYGKFGLFNIKERVDLHGGIFEIKSEPGKGTKAVLEIPLKEKAQVDKEIVQQKDTRLPADGKKQQEQKQVKVLLVDDHKMVRRGLRQLIEKQEDIVIVGEASQGQEAVELTRETMPDIIVMDVNMPVMDGIEATQKIKGEFPHIQIIGLSLHESEEVIKSMQGAGASAYLTKNAAFESLVTTIRAESSSGNGR